MYVLLFHLEMTSIKNVFSVVIFFFSVTKLYLKLLWLSVFIITYSFN